MIGLRRDDVKYDVVIFERNKRFFKNIRITNVSSRWLINELKRCCVTKNVL